MVLRSPVREPGLGGESSHAPRGCSPRRAPSFAYSDACKPTQNRKIRSGIQIGKSHRTRLWKNHCARPPFLSRQMPLRPLAELSHAPSGTPTRPAAPRLLRAGRPIGLPIGLPHLVRILLTAQAQHQYSFTHPCCRSRASAPLALPFSAAPRAAPPGLAPHAPPRAGLRPRAYSGNGHRRPGPYRSSGANATSCSL